MAVGDTRDKGAERNSLSSSGDETKAGLALQNRVLRRGKALHLKPMVHERELGTTAFLGSLGGRSKRRAERLRTSREREVDEVDT